jgi:hypothetical protein
MADWTSLTYAIVDVEGNGHQPPGLVELVAAAWTSPWLRCFDHTDLAARIAHGFCALGQGHTT